MNAKGMKVKTDLKAGGFLLQLRPSLPLRLGIETNHNETMVRDAAKAKGLTVKTHVKAGWVLGGITLIWRGGW